MRNLVASRLVALAFVLIPEVVTAQIQVVGPGSTVEGDVRRGEGVFLQGLGWYELNDAKAAAIYSETMRKNDAYIRQQNAEARRAYNVRVDAVARKQKLDEVAKARYLAERESRLRANPTPEDIEEGDALNALLVDLSDPTIQSSSWRGSQVALPEDISIKGLAFQFTPRPGAKASAALTQGLIALGRLDTAGRWPDVFPLDKLQPEITAYETAYAAICEQSKAKRLELPTVLAMDRSLKTLKSRVQVVVPLERGFRSEATRYVEDLIAATNMFNASTLGYAREMIVDTSQHEAHTVGELLAFMRKYRLVFAQADATPGGSEMYSRLYGLLRNQSESLNLQPKRPQVEPAKDAEFPPNFPAKIVSGTWKIENGELIQSSDQVTSDIIFGQKSWSHYDLRYDVRFDSGQAGNWIFIDYVDERNRKNLYCGAYNNTKFGLGAKVNGIYTKTEIRQSIEYGRWYSVLVEVRGATVRWLMDDKLVIEHTDERPSPGRIGLGGMNTSFRFRNIRVSTPDGKVLLKGFPH